MHNNIMAAGSKDHPPMLDQEDIHNGDHIFYDTLTLKEMEVPQLPSESYTNVWREQNYIFQVKRKAIILAFILMYWRCTYSTVDACNIANEMWIAIERLQQGESVNVQDVKTNMFWEFRKFTSRDGESMESYYSRKKTEDTTSRYNNDNQSVQFGNQRTMTVPGARETVGSQKDDDVQTSEQGVLLQQSTLIGLEEDEEIDETTN
ncbi:hypothetical protein Tco_0439148 [Tanacetum coccineum]